MTIGNHGYIVFGESSNSGGNQPSNQLWRFTPGTSGIGDRDGLADVLLTGSTPGTVQLIVPEGSAGPVQASLVDVHGRTVAQEALFGTGRNVLATDLPTGMYLARLRRNGVTTTRKVMVQQ